MTEHRLSLTARRSGALAVLLALVLAVLPAPLAQADWVRDYQWWLSEYGITQAWQTTKGEGVRIAIIDSGVDASHQDLVGAVVDGADMSGRGVRDGTAGIGVDPDHGTMVASLAAGRGRGSDGIIGVAPKADLLAISLGFGMGGDLDQQIADAVIWAVDHGADVINLSLTRTSATWPESWDKAFLYAFEHDVVVVAAAGNRGSGTTMVGAPATIPGVLTVAGVDRRGKASFDASTQGITIGVSAPSEDLVGAIPGNGYVTWAGTSGAAPIVSGIVALVRSAHPDLDANNVIQRIIATAKPQSSQAVDPIYGRGLVDAAKAVSAKVPTVSENPMGDLKEWIRLYRRAESGPEPTNPEPGSAPEGVERVESASDVAEWGFLPSMTTLRNDWLPAWVIGGFGLCAILLLIAAGRYFWRARRRG